LWLVGTVGWLAAAAGASGATIWQSTFDAGPDGVVDVFNNNSGKQMIGPVTSGRLQITTQDNGTDAYTPDKAGRPLGTTRGPSDAFSGLYRFNWSGLNESEAPQTYELAGFLGNASPQTRQVLGTILRHWKAGADYYVGVDLAFESNGSNVGGFGYNAGPATWLGTSATTRDLQLAVGYEGSSHTLSVGLYDANGTPLIERSDTLENILPGTSGESAAIAGMALTHLGWSDYSANLSNNTTVWQNDSLAYFDTANGAQLAAVAGVPEPASFAVLSVVAAGAALRRRR
jgi:hypothetical protein